MERDENGILEEFRIEFLDSWQKLPNKAFFFVLLGAWLLLFQLVGNSTFGYISTPSLFQYLYTIYNPPKESAYTDDGHGMLIPLVVLGLLWWKRKELLGRPLQSWWGGLAIVLFALALHVLGYAAQQPRVSTVALFAGIYGLTGLAWGYGWLKASFFPFILFVFSVPLGSLAEPITFPLRLLVTRIVEGVSHYGLAIDVLREGTTLHDPTGRYKYEVAVACSGMRSLIATIALSLCVAFLALKSWWRRGILIASAVPLAVLGNVFRMLTIVIAAEIGGQEAGSYVHDGGPGGVLSLLPYVPAFLGLMLLEKWLREPRATGPRGGGAPPETSGQPDVEAAVKLETKAT